MQVCHENKIIARWMLQFYFTHFVKNSGNQTDHFSLGREVMQDAGNALVSTLVYEQLQC